MRLAHECEKTGSMERIRGDSMSFSLIVGIVIALGALLVGFTLEKGVLLSLFLLSPFIIVFGGTLGAVIASSTFKDLLAALKALGKSFKKTSEGTPTKILDKISSLSETARKNGLIALEPELQNPELDKEDMLMLKEGIVLLIIGKTSDEIRYILSSDIRAYLTQRQLEIEIFESASGFSPTMGIIGTVLGLVQVLSNFSSPEELTKSIATAFIATLYGVTFANIIFLPIATRLKRNMKRQHMQKEMILDGICMIAEGVAPRDMQNHLALYYQAFDEVGKYKQGISN